MFYEESRHLEEEDIGYDAPIYHMNLYDKSVLITVGKERRLVQKKNAYYFPIYLLHNFQVQCQIGAFEFESSKETQEERMKPFLDSSGDLDVNRFKDPVFYSFANYDYFQTITNTVTPVILKEMEAAYISKHAENKEEEENDSSSLPFELNKEDVVSTPSVQKATKILKEGVFTIHKTNVKHLTEESKEDAHKIKESYVETGKSEWIEKYMKNNQYAIVSTLSNGDCLFDTVRLAFEQMGYETTIQRLRSLVAKEVTKEQFQEYRELYQTTLAEIADMDKKLAHMKAENSNLKKRLEETTDKPKRAEIIKHANEIKQQHSTLVKTQKMNREFLEEFAHMRSIDSIEKFREFVLSNSYWADDWAIGVLERELNVKFIIFSETDYEEDDENNVIRCTLSSEESKREFSPDFYIMTTYSGNHYRLISYSNKYIFDFREIPYDVKTMIVIKCMERNSGTFSRIPDFMSFKTRVGVPDEEEEEEEDEIKGGGLYRLDKDTIFTFYDKSNKTHKPGKASNEKIRTDKIHEYTELAVQDNWRKKLDDDWSSTFVLDNKKWKTVEHYYQASKFKKHNPHFYNQFSLDDTKSELATHVELARAAGSQKGILKKGKKQIPMRPSEIKIDADFYGGRHKEEREKALYAKFSQNEDLKSILLLTKNATLRKFIPKQKPETDVSLMTVRQRLQMEN